MARLKKDEKKVQLAQKAYDDGIDHFLVVIESLNIDILEICDRIHGHTMGWASKADPDNELDPYHKYDLSSAQLAALKDQRNFWLQFIKAPDKVLEHINNNLREKHKSDVSDKILDKTDKTKGSNVKQFSMNSK